MKVLYFFCFVSLLLSCGTPGSAKPSKPAEGSVPIGDSLPIEAYSITTSITDSNYAAVCTRLKLQKARLAVALDKGQVTLDSVSNFFTESYLNHILPHWYGTLWGFSGTTTKPGEGEIACSYLVSTTLYQMGFNLNRYKVAQQTPENEALTYALRDTLIYFSSPAGMIRTLQIEEQFKDGFYFIGLAQSHVGLLLKRGGQVFFIHSNYVSGKTVIERAIDSPVLFYYNTFYVAPLSHNAGLLKSWLNGTSIAVKTS